MKRFEYLYSQKNDTFFCSFLHTTHIFYKYNKSNIRYTVQSARKLSELSAIKNCKNIKRGFKPCLGKLLMPLYVF